ncbi:MAG: DUF4442 domain-containing protein [Cocleimonas sp.]|nr:DUF4442 domain-containing protein [Cocleimonas sp.]
MQQKKQIKEQSLAAEQRLTVLWRRLGGSSFGRWIFDHILWYSVPYSGSIRPHVEILSLGYVEVSMKDRRKVRNHLQCLHAIALANLGELASGLAMLSALPVTTRAIVSHIEVEYIKKAYGTVTATGIAKAVASAVKKPVRVVVKAEIKNQQGEIVAIVHVMWHLSSKKRR